MIEVRNLTKRYGDHTAVSELSFTVEDGTIYGFLGPNGAGKTTTMNMMTGYLAPTSGEVIVNGHNISEEPEEAKKTIGYLPEIPPVYPDLTVREYLQFAAELKKIPKREQKEEIEKAISELDLGDVENRLIRNLSKGYRQRVGFAQALLGNPETLILDEPTVGLDPRQIIEIRMLIRKLGEKHTVILSSHILSEVSEICDRVLIISHGKIAACGTPEELQSGHRKSYLTILAEGPVTRAASALEQIVPRESIRVMELENTDKVMSTNAAQRAVAETQEALSRKFRIRIDQDSNEDIRGRVSRALFEAGLTVIEMKQESESLEKIFLSLTDDDSSSELSPSSARGEDDPEDEDEPTGFFSRLFGKRKSTAKAGTGASGRSAEAESSSENMSAAAAESRSENKSAAKEETE